MHEYIKIVKTGHLIFFTTLFGLFAASPNDVESAADRLIIQDQYSHVSSDLHTIAKFGHTLPQDKKDQLAAIGFDFSKELVSTYRPQNLDESVESGFFKFHYTQSGDDAVSVIDADGNGIPDYVDLIVATFDSIGQINFNEMEYVRPPSDGWYWQSDNGGSDHYDVYIFNLESGYYGYVQAEDYAQNTGISTRGDNEYSEDVEEERAMTTFMALRNNYDGFTGIESEIIQVTSAHEFFHAVQYGYDGWEAGWLLESTAVWMEEVHYDDINDCYQFLEEFFEDPDLGINHDVNRGYGAYIYFSYLTENQTNNNFIKTIFEHSVEYDSFEEDYSIATVIAALDDHGLEFEEVTHDFLIANAVLSSDSSAGIYAYAEADSFPMSDPVYESTVTSMTDTVEYFNDLELETFSALYYLVDTSDSTWANLAIDLLSADSDDMNYYVTSVVQDTNGMYSFLTSDTQTLDVANIDTVVFLVSAFGYDTTDTEFSLRIIKNSSVIMGTETEEMVPVMFNLYPPYPNPFNPATTIRFSVEMQSFASLHIYDITGRLVETLVHGKLESGECEVVWDASNLASGIYFVVASGEGFTLSRRIVLLK